MNWIQYDSNDKKTFPPIATHVMATWLESGKGRVSGVAMMGFSGKWYQIKNPIKGGFISENNKKEIVFDQNSLGWMLYEIPEWWKPKA